MQQVRLPAFDLSTSRFLEIINKDSGGSRAIWQVVIPDVPWTGREQVSPLPVRIRMSCGVGYHQLSGEHSDVADVGVQERLRIFDLLDLDLPLAPGAYLQACPALLGKRCG
jgi:hypothetical protein